MLFAFLLAMLAAPADWVPARWPSSDPKSLELLEGTPVNCLLLEARDQTPEFLDAAAARGIATLAVVRPGSVPEAVSPKLAGVVLEGEWAEVPRISGARTVIEIFPRSRIRWDSGAAVIGTYQAVWPGIRPETDTGAHAAPSGGPWIDTNSGFLRYARAASGSTVWIANTPPPKTAVTTERYLQVVADAAILGARWVVALDEDLNRRLLAREPQAVKAWKRIADQIAWFESNPKWRSYQPIGQLAIIQDPETGALYSGGVLDMISVKHTPVIPVPRTRLSDETMGRSKMAVNVDPSRLTEEQKETLRRFTRAGGTLLSGPPDWKFPPMTAGEITLGKEDVKKLDEIWKELNQMTGRRNLGARLFNVSSMLSNLLRSPDGREVILHLVNYSDYPVENVTVHVLGKFRGARLLAPGAAPKKLETYEVEEGAGTGVDIDQVGVTATLVLEPVS